MLKIGAAPVGGSRRFFELELQRWKKVIDVAGIKLER